MSEIADVLDAWQRGEISGQDARRRTGARSYGYLYRLIRDHEVEVRFRPGDVARRILDGTLTPEEGQDMLGIEDVAEMPSFVSSWTALARNQYD
ncbi:hypothetical protein NOJ05_01355 [Neorhizobium galegae]|uniref:hypothetical protein n=1 Tax=Neorhizobium galegae TaxID=399 RepID=UPI002103BA34|nr:hypothetical protein [Neorhizobium galegae]MCQ1775843.1 hypothetical protein [Neorhizobium galegae]MCQ1797982.1 hypothetical protein [Neorhizobium galegae]